MPTAAPRYRTILALDIGTDTPSAVALGAEPPGRHSLSARPFPAAAELDGCSRASRFALSARTA